MKTDARVIYSIVPTCHALSMKRLKWYSMPKFTDEVDEVFGYTGFEIMCSIPVSKFKNRKDIPWWLLLHTPLETNDLLVKTS